MVLFYLRPFRFKLGKSGREGALENVCGFKGLCLLVHFSIMEIANTTYLQVLINMSYILSHYLVVQSNSHIDYVPVKCSV